MTDPGAPHGAILLQRGSDNIVAVASGLARSYPDISVTLGTRFQIASATKQFTAAAVLLLADRGILSVHDPVRRWLDDCPPAWDPVSLHHLLSHTAGLTHWPGLPGLDVTRPVATSEKLRIFAAAPLLSQAGEKFAYSSPGYVLLAHIIEAAAGQPYGAFLAREIFEPLGMVATFDGHPHGQSGLAAGFKNSAPVSSMDLGTLGLGTGSIWSTVADLARWDRALASGNILTPAATEAMFTVHVPVDADDGLVRTEGYGYGWFIGSAAGRRLFYHPGDNPGYRSFNAWFPDDDVRLIVLSNEDSTQLDPVVHSLISTAFPAR